MPFKAKKKHLHINGRFKVKKPLHINEADFQVLREQNCVTLPVKVIRTDKVEEDGLRRLVADLKVDEVCLTIVRVGVQNLGMENSF